MRIYREPLQIGKTTVPMPVGAKILHTGAADGNVCIWFMFEKKRPQVMEDREFLVVVTGIDFELPPGSQFMGTVIFEDEHTQRFVAHAFMLGRV